ncbi:ATP-binding protein [Celerinatantimonas sp. MCCC 1A17872]|uniref:YobI family P-loop NTPase n=1 Tax=Celerinatantimonas sp. MCCC 1A17872 TaxID=3177514 RepID=UPI0038C83A07
MAITSLIFSIATKYLRNSATWLERRIQSTDKQPKFVDLAPTDKADKTGIYSEAILYAMNNPKVSNIALTGPYGSGKSSIIQVFLKKYQPPALHISLASFISNINVEDKSNINSLNKEKEERVDRQEIERSILQQMLYGADANKLPLSRFKRIQVPGFSAIFKSLFIMLGILACWYVFHIRTDIISSSFFVPLSHTKLAQIGILAFAAIFFWVILHHIYITSLGLSIKSISLKDVEIKPAYSDETSILNRHLDEIIYFFQTTKYRLVVIEDLDRFNDAEIFVTLREINSLINENAGVKRPIKFLYALRDGMFISTDRTKFFEFIIPVIPIISTANSIDMVLEQEIRLDLDDRLDRQFLREVSQYLNDLRLIQNIFNEYTIYVTNLETDGEALFNADKLLAILIYKNVYPSDFEQLHRKQGTFAAILNLRDILINKRETDYRAEIKKLEQQLKATELQVFENLKELRQIYTMNIIEALPADTINIGSHNGTLIALSKLTSHNLFDQLLEDSRIRYQRSNHPIQSSNNPLDSDSRNSYKQRKKVIEDKAVDNKSNIINKIRNLRSKITQLRTAKLKDILQSDSNQTMEHFKTLGEHYELARFLILEGYIDDTYYQYTSLFHSGRLSPNDNKFLIKIRAFITPEPNFPIDNSQEVIASMRDEDFRQSYVLNVKLVDTLLHNEVQYSQQLQKLFEYISSEFENCEDFFEAYYTSGKCIKKLLSQLTNKWQQLVPTMIASPKNTNHITQLIANLQEGMLEELAKDFETLPKFVASNLPDILTYLPEMEPSHLISLNFKVKDIPTISEHSEIIKAMFNEGLFEVTIPNIEYIYQKILGEDDLQRIRESNFTTICSLSNKTLKEQIEQNFNGYLHNILLKLPANSQEDEQAIIEIACHDTLNEDSLQKFFEQQITLLSNIKDVPNRLHSMLFRINKVKATWTNCLAFIENPEYEEDSLLGYLDRDDIRKVILEQPIPRDSSSKQLRICLFHANALSNTAYGEYIHNLPNPFQTFPQGVDDAKLIILITEKKISFTKKNLDSLSPNESLQVLFVTANIDTYLNDPSDFELDDEFLEQLLKSEINDEDKQRVVGLIDLKTIGDHPERAALIGKIINNSNSFDISNLDGNIAQELIIHSKPIEMQISLFNKCHSLMTNDDIRNILVKLPQPYSEITTGFHIPKLEITQENLNLVKWLTSRNIISSWKETALDSIKISLYRKQRE